MRIFPGTTFGFRLNFYFLPSLSRSPRMLRLLGSPRRCCDGLTRRETLQAGMLGLLGGLALPHALGADDRLPPHPYPSPPLGRGVGVRGRAKSVIVLYLLGGAATQDMVDLKP